jgi:hypothetical protein
MRRGLHRSYGAHHLHFITCWCYQRLPFLRTARSRDRFLSILEQTRERYRFVRKRKLGELGPSAASLPLLAKDARNGAPTELLMSARSKP